MDNSGKLSGAQIDREWFLYQEKEVFAEYRQKRLTIGLPNETERRDNRVDVYKIQGNSRDYLSDHAFDSMGN